MNETEIHTSIAIIELAYLKQSKEIFTDWNGFRLRCAMRDDQKELLLESLEALKNQYNFIDNYHRADNKIAITLAANINIQNMKGAHIDTIQKLSVRRCLLFKLYEEYLKEEQSSLYSLVNEASSLEVTSAFIYRETTFLDMQGLLEYKVCDGGNCTSSLLDNGIFLCDSLDELFSSFSFINKSEVNEITCIGETKMNIEIKPDRKKVFVVHGRNKKASDAIFDFLRSIGLTPIEWTEAKSETGEGSPYIGDIIKKPFEKAQAIVILLTGDDIARLRNEYIEENDPDHEKEFTPQARANVIFEAGRAFGICAERTILVQLSKEKIRPFSDISGRHFIIMSNDAAKRTELVTALKTAGCEVDTENKTSWLKTGDFDSAALSHNVINNGKQSLSEETKYEKLASDIGEEFETCLWLLSHLAEYENDLDNCIKGNLFREYERRYNKSKKYFNILVNDLIRHDLVAIDIGFGYDSEEYLKLLEEGFLFLKYLERTKYKKSKSSI